MDDELKTSELERCSGRRGLRAELEASYKRVIGANAVAPMPPVPLSVRGPKWPMRISRGATTMNPGFVSQAQMPKAGVRERARRLAEAQRLAAMQRGASQ